MSGDLLGLVLFSGQEQADAQCDQDEAVEAAEEAYTCNVGDGEECYQGNNAECDREYAQDHTLDRAGPAYRHSFRPPDIRI